MLGFISFHVGLMKCMLSSFQLLPRPYHVSSLEGPAVPQYYVLTLLSTTPVMLAALLESHNVYCLTSTLSVVVTSAMNGLVVSCSSYSPAISFTSTPVGNATISVVAPPSAPTITSLISTYSDQLTVTWTSVPTATSYNVSINASVNTLVPIPSTGAPQYMWNFTGLTNNTVYTVSVVAINCAGSSSPATMTGRTDLGHCIASATGNTTLTGVPLTKVFC
eukprot:Em0005g345a